jgi:hypothetical protein
LWEVFNYSSQEQMLKETKNPLEALRMAMSRTFGGSGDQPPLPLPPNETAATGSGQGAEAAQVAEATQAAVAAQAVEAAQAAEAAEEAEASEATGGTVASTSSSEADQSEYFNLKTCIAFVPFSNLDE